jgi:hypothetical protein
MTTLDHGLQAMLDLLTGYLGNSATRTEWLVEIQKRFTGRDGKLRRGWSDDAIDRKITKLEAMGYIIGGRGRGEYYSAVLARKLPANEDASGCDSFLDVLKAAEQQLLKGSKSSSVWYDAFMPIADSIKGQIAQAKYIIRQQMARIAELEAEVERLRSAAGAHDVLRSIYSDANQPTGHRLKAAGLALGHESPPLKPAEAPLDLVATEEIEPLASVVARQRARADRMMALPLEERAALIRGCNSGNGGNGQDD